MATVLFDLLDLDPRPQCGQTPLDMDGVPLTIPAALKQGMKGIKQKSNVDLNPLPVLVPIGRFRAMVVHEREPASWQLYA